MTDALGFLSPKALWERAGVREIRGEQLSEATTNQISNKESKDLQWQHDFAPLIEILCSQDTTRGDFSSSKSQRLPYKSSKTATVP